jgi:transposase
MELEAGVLVSPTAEVPVIDGDIVSAIRDLARRGVGSKAIAKQLGIARNTVRRYRRQPVTAGVQVRPAARKLSDADCEAACALYASVAAGNAVVVRRLLAERGVVVSERTIQRAVAGLRREQRAAALATVRVETAPGDQLQIDFGQKRVSIAGTRVRIFLLVAVLSCGGSRPTWYRRRRWRRWAAISPTTPPSSRRRADERRRPCARRRAVDPLAPPLCRRPARCGAE